MRAVVLLSGGLDSATVLAIARSEGRVVHALSFVYGQRHEVELGAARRVVAAAGAEEHIVFPIDLRLFGGSALTGDIDVPKDDVGAEGIPVTYVPARNTIFLAIARGLAEGGGAGGGGRGAGSGAVRRATGSFWPWRGGWARGGGRGRSGSA